MNAINELSGVTADNWMAICQLDDIVPDTGGCALLEGRHVAVFRVGDASPKIFAIDNVDPNAGASVLSRGLVGSIGERIVVASPIYKQHYRLRDGQCLEAPHQHLRVWPVR